MAWPKTKMFRLCISCGELFESQNKRDFCSQECRGSQEPKKKPPDKLIYIRICPSCSKEFSTTNAGRRLCTYTCRREQEQIRQVEWFSLREFVLERDNYTCQECGEMKIDAGLHVHHIYPVYKGGQSVEENLIALCHDCHRDKHRNRE